MWGGVEDIREYVVDITGEVLDIWGEVDDNWGEGIDIWTVIWWGEVDIWGEAEDIWGEGIGMCEDMLDTSGEGDDTPDASDRKVAGAISGIL